MLRELQKPRDSTVAARRRAVDRVVHAMQQCLSEPMTLREMARIALMSPFHFDRVFHATTGVSPRLFRAALRIEAAKRLLLETQMSVTSICFEVGYESLGSFISRFSKQVGASPRVLRRMASEAAARAIPEAANREVHRPEWPPFADEGMVRGRIVADEDRPGLVFVGLFAEDVPHVPPIRCGCRRGPGEFRLGPVPDGRWHLLAASFPCTNDPTDYLLPDMADLFVARGREPVSVVGGAAPRVVN